MHMTITPWWHGVHTIQICGNHLSGGAVFHIQEYEGPEGTEGTEGTEKRGDFGYVSNIIGGP